MIAERYDERRDAFELVFRSGTVVAIPRALVPELGDAAAPTLKSVSVSLAGDAVCWRSLDVDIDVRGLAERAGHEI